MNDLTRNFMRWLRKLLLVSVAYYAVLGFLYLVVRFLLDAGYVNEACIVGFCSFVSFGAYLGWLYGYVTENEDDFSVR